MVRKGTGITTGLLEGQAITISTLQVLVSVACDKGTSGADLYEFLTREFVQIASLLKVIIEQWTLGMEHSGLDSFLPDS